MARHDRAWVWGLAAAYAAIFSFLSVVKYRYYLYTDFDLAIFVQTTDRILHGSFYSSIAGLNLLGAHSALNLALLAPIFALFRHPLTLLVIQSCALALGAVAARRLARRVLGDGAIAVIFAALYLLYPAIGYTNLFEFHSETLSTPALLFALDYGLAGRPLPTALCAALALLGREDAAFPVALLGLYLLVTRQPRAAAAAIALGALAAASLLVSFGYLQRRFATGEVQYLEMYRAWGRSGVEIVVNVLRQPWRVAQWMVSTPDSAYDSTLKQQYWLHMLLPLGLLPLLSPWTLAIAAPILVEHFLSFRINQHAIVNQYTALVSPFFVGAAALGLRNLLRRVAPADPASPGAPRAQALGRALALAALAASVVSNLLFGPLLGHGRVQGLRPTQRIWPNTQDRTLLPYRDRMVARVPRDAGVITSFEYLPRFAAHENVQSYQHLFSGHYTFSTKPYAVPTGIAVMLTALGNQYDPGAWQRTRELIQSEDLHPVDEADDVILWLRGARDTVELLTLGEFDPAAQAQVVFDGQLRFRGCDLLGRVRTPGEVLTLRTYWRRVAPGDRVFLTRLWIIDRQDREVFYRTRYLGYGVATPDQWPEGRTARETYRIVLPGDLARGTYDLVMQVAHKTETGGEPALPDDPSLIASGRMMALGSFEVR